MQLDSLLKLLQATNIVLLRKKLLSRLAVIAIGLCSVMISACTGINSRIEHYEKRLPKEFIIILPEGRAALDPVKKFAAYKRSNGYEISTIEFSLNLKAWDRVTAVQKELEKLKPAKRLVLILASAEELPMGPWKVEHLKDSIDSDIPLFLGVKNSEQSINQKLWAQAGSPEFPWYIGRIPYTEEAGIATCLFSSKRVEDNKSKVALLGSERFAVWWDSSLIMSRARRRFDSNWNVITYGQDWPCDIQLAKKYRSPGQKLLQDFPEDAFKNGKYPNGQLLAAHWAHLSPSIVYLNSHGATLFGIEVGHYLLSELRISHWQKQASVNGLRSRPKSPGILIVAACQAGPADSALMRRLFAHGWIGAMVASTELTAPVPLWPAIQAEVDTASVLNSDLPIAMGLQLFRESYLEDADDSFSFVLSNSTRAAVAKNILGLTLYGDPSLRLPGKTSKAKAEQ